MEQYFIISKATNMLLIILLCLSTILTLPLYASDHLVQQILSAKGITYSAYPNCTEAGTFADRVHKVCSPCSSQCMEDNQYPFDAECCDELRKCRNNAAGKISVDTIINERLSPDTFDIACHIAAQCLCHTVFSYSFLYFLVLVLFLVI